MIMDASNRSSAISKHDINWLDYPLKVLIPFKVIAKPSRTSGILNTL